MNGDECHLPITAILANIFQQEMIGKFQIVTKPVVMEAVGTNCTNVLGGAEVRRGELEKRHKCNGGMSYRIDRK